MKKTYFIFQPLQQTKARIALNLILAPIGGILIYTPLLLFLPHSTTPALDSPFTVMSMILLLFITVYMLIGYLPLLPYLLLLKHYNKFNLLNILFVIFVITLIFSYFCNSRDLFKPFYMLLFFNLPATLFFILLTLRSHRKNLNPTFKKQQSD